ncbi:Coenzyme F420 hydrogenase/dehydrogenase, beta subunit C-terminal domain [Desulfotalea psychrophila]|nr:Coenzyme F420 hydrogenase/dehydrogenase, beta subunit C-terminal domain [Desulfotalea psychrophila]
MKIKHLFVSETQANTYTFFSDFNDSAHYGFTMIHLNTKEDCCGCHACLSICPAKCIQMLPDTEGFLYPMVDESLCPECGLCESVCPVINPPRQEGDSVAFAAWNRNEDVRADSSSGGVFNALMQCTFEQNGVVFGAAFDDSMTLCHQAAHNEVEGQALRGSKYLQSTIGTAYQEARKYLKQGRQVLFSGTPCQIAGLYAFLRKEYDNLLTCDVVCHGVPSPKVFAAYRAELERQHGAKAQRIAFRRKNFGWKRFSVSLSFDNDTEYRRVLNEDAFMIGFLSNTYLRPSCHACNFSRLPRVADISLADFWGVGTHHPEWDDDRGTSLVIVQTEKGKSAFDACRQDITVHDADLNVAIQSNPCICGSVAPGARREAFFSDLNTLPFEKVMKRYMRPTPLWRRRAGKVKRLAGRVLRRMRVI